MRTNVARATMCIALLIAGCRGPQANRPFEFEGAAENSRAHLLPAYTGLTAPIDRQQRALVADPAKTGRGENRVIPASRTVAAMEEPVPAKDSTDLASPFAMRTATADGPNNLAQQLAAPQSPELTLGPPAPNDYVTPDRPIDLATALQLAGGQNWSIQLAREQTRQAMARSAAAQAAWLPSLNLGISWTKHDGQIQATDGTVTDISRNSLFIGGGGVTRNAPTTGGAGGPSRLQVDFSLADALFAPLAARQRFAAAQASESTTFNDTLLRAAMAYYDLVEAQGQLANAVANTTDAQRVLELTDAFVAAGKASPSEVDRVRVELDNRRQESVRSRLAIQVASAELARVLRIDSAQHGAGQSVLYSADGNLTPVQLISDDHPLQALIGQAMNVRPEVTREQCLAESEFTVAEAERWRPWLPHVYMGLSAGVFGGGVGDELDKLDGRADVDAMLVWQMKNLGYGNAAAQRETESRHREAVFRSHQIKDRIAADVTQAWHGVRAQSEAIAIAKNNVQQAVRVYEQNQARIRGLEGLPLEALQSLQAIASARASYLDAVISYNRSQLALLRSIGQPLQ